MLAPIRCDPAEALADAQRRPIPRTRILLADDIRANQLVTATLLRRAGHSVDVVANGEAAVEAVRTVPYDLILMDVFMPGMDGQEVAHIIRSLPAPACAIPILALTAGVSKEDEAAFRAAGMNGVLRKPVSFVELVDALRTCVWSPHRTGKAPSAPVGTPAGPEIAFPRAVLSYARIAELRTNLPPETFATLIEECLADLDHRLPALRRAVTAASPAAITAHAHAMVGTAAGYGMTALETRLRMIIAAVRDGAMMTLTAASVAEVEADLTEAARLLRDIAQSEPV
ncbi:MAG: response regulator [Rhodopila sp.]